MPDKKLTDAEIKKALECCVESKHICSHTCPMLKNKECLESLRKHTLDLINRLQAENERLKKAYLRNQEIFAEQSLENERLKAEIDFYKHSPMVTLFEQWKKETKAEAYKEFAERLKKHSYFDHKDQRKVVAEVIIDHYLKELVGNDV